MEHETQSELNRFAEEGLLDLLLTDRTTGGRIHWATSEYLSLGSRYSYSAEMTSQALLQEDFCLKSRVEKRQAEQARRTRARAEVFTPFWVVKTMNDYADQEWFGRSGVFDLERVYFPAGRTWMDYVNSRRLEITCGEGPYLTSRYDATTGEKIPFYARTGVLDRKLRVITENAADDAEWVDAALKACKATYGFEFQGDNLLLARLNLILAVEENMEHVLHRLPTREEYEVLLNVIAWNVWQMNGLTGTTPVPVHIKKTTKYTKLLLGLKLHVPCRIYDWQENTSVLYKDLKKTS